MYDLMVHNISSFLFSFFNFFFLEVSLFCTVFLFAFPFLSYFANFPFLPSFSISLPQFTLVSCVYLRFFSSTLSLIFLFIYTFLVILFTFSFFSFISLPLSVSHPRPPHTPSFGFEVFYLVRSKVGLPGSGAL